MSAIWDAALAAAMQACGLAIAEEVVTADLLTDLRRGGSPPAKQPIRSPAWSSADT